MKKFFKIFTIITLVSVLFDGYVISIGPTYLRIYQFLLPIALLMYVLMNKNIKRHILILYKKTPLKYFTWFILWILIDAFILLIIGRATFLIFYYIFIKFFSLFLVATLFFALVVPKPLSIKQFIKIFTMSTFCVFILAVMEFIGGCFSISVITKFIDIISNYKIITWNQVQMLDAISGTRRIRSLFHEPSTLSQYIFLTMPIFYSLIGSKYKIFDNCYINKVVKITFIPLMWFVLIMTQSPIYLIFCTLLTIFYFHKKIFNFIKIFWIYIIPSTLLFVAMLICINNVNIQDLQHTFLGRITNVIFAKSLDEIVMKAPSLGIRLSCIINSIRAALAHPIIGYGYDNLRFYIEQYYLSSPIMLTREQIAALTYARVPGTGVGVGHTGFTQLFSETGIIGTILFYLFMVKCFIYLLKIEKSCFGIEKILCSGLSFFVCSSAVISIYMPLLSNVNFCTLCGLICALSYKYAQSKFIIKGRKNDEKNIINIPRT